MLSNTLNTIFLMALTVAAAPSTPGAHLETRGDIKDCDNTKNNYSGGFSDGQGTYVSSDQVSRPMKGGLIRKCWYDYFVVEAQAALDPWKQASGEQHCVKGQSCSVASLAGGQTCQSRSTTVSVEVGLKIEEFTLGVSVSTTTEKSKCTSASNTSQCSWTDGGCHVVWTQQQVLQQKGYRRQRCNFGHGDETQCMANWDMRTPTTMINYGCGSKCGDQNTCGNTNGKAC
ncbi:hypothetical protein PG995_012660 [Apiospora arundinis]